MKSSINQFLTILIFSFIGWIGCASIMGIGMSVTSIKTTLIIHLIGAPILFSILSIVYFTKYGYTSALQTAVFFTSFIVLIDFFIVALLIKKSLDMFKSVIGTWIPFTLIFLVVFFVGKYYKK